MSRPSSIAVVVLVWQMASANAQVFTINDTVFTSSNWSTVNGGGQNVLSVSTYLQTGGVTGNQRGTIISGFSPIQYNVRHYKTDVTYNPSVLGSFSSMNWELWYKFSGSQGNFSSLKMVARQGGVEYVANASYTDPALAVSFWQKASGTLLVSSYTRLSPTGPTSLDLSPTGAPIQFGYMNFSEVNLFTSSVNVQDSFFNLSFQTIPVPEPSLGIVAIGAGAIGLLRLFGKKRNRIETDASAPSGSASFH